MAAITRPRPPGELLGLDTQPAFIPAPEVWEWARASFVEQGGPLENPDHAHLAAATVGVVWTNIPNRRQMRGVVGMAESPQPTRSAWGAEAVYLLTLEEWFGEVPDFRITLDAGYSAQADDLSFCALVEHELYHCAQKQGEFGPKFTKDGTPMFGIRGHDAEEFVGIVRRYGLAGAAGGVRELVAAAARPPEVGVARIAAACGTCLRLVA
jgi:hypothetical protein